MHDSEVLRNLLPELARGLCIRIQNVFVACLHEAHSAGLLPGENRQALLGLCLLFSTVLLTECYQAPQYVAYPLR